MSSAIRIGIIGDYDGRPSHLATEEAIRHCSEKSGLLYVVDWLPTLELEKGAEDILCIYDGLWCAPGSPYQSMLGAVRAIQYARENDIPFLGTCGGFQHAALEFAMNVLKIEEIQKSGFDPYSPNLFLSALSCSLVGQTKQILLGKDSRLFEIYGCTKIEERYNCSFGLQKDFQNQLEQGGLKVTGTDEEGEARIMLIEKNRFFVATLFQPQLSSTIDHPHPLIMAYIKSSHSR
ncbi:MAG TPA: hypothetical protein VN131_05160 [Mobilitalea sp.]|nr:hypothetical protein [Mobilitalea sp.]